MRPFPRLAASLLLLMTPPLAAEAQEEAEELTSDEPKPVQEYVYAGSRLLAVVPPPVRKRRYGLSLPAAPLVVSEKVWQVKIPVKLIDPAGGSTSHEVRVEYATVAGTAEAGSDFTPASGVLVFPAGCANGTTKEIVVPILNDWTGEPDETFSVTLANPVGAAIDLPLVQTVLVVDDDPPADAPSEEP